MQNIRAGLILTLFLGLTLPLMPVQLVLFGLKPRWARRLPHWYHRLVCRIIGVRVVVDGTVPDGRPVLLISNHVSWLDIPVLGAVAPVSFVAKHEVGTWPFIAWLAKLQQSVFINREQRGSVAATASEIMERLHSGDSIVLFAEGTTGDGNNVLPFRTSLFAAAKPSGKNTATLQEGVFVQTVALGYTRLQGLPLGRPQRPHIAWYGDMVMTSHAWQLLKRGPLDVHIRLGEPVALKNFSDRKALARYAEARVNADVAEILNPRQ